MNYLLQKKQISREAEEEEEEGYWQGGAYSSSLRVQQQRHRGSRRPSRRRGRRRGDRALPCRQWRPRCSPGSAPTWHRHRPSPVPPAPGISPPIPPTRRAPTAGPTPPPPLPPSLPFLGTTYRRLLALLSLSALLPPSFFTTTRFWRRFCPGNGYGVGSDTSNGMPESSRNARFWGSWKGMS